MRILYLIEKEFKQLRRNILLPIVFMLLPVALMNIVPRVATQEIRDLRLCIVDYDHSSFSRQLTQKLDASVYMDLSVVAQSEKEAMLALDKAEADLFVVIPHGFEKSLYRHTLTENPVYVAVNATNGMKGAMGQSYVNQIIINFVQDAAQSLGVSISPDSRIGKSISLRYAFNTHLDYKVYMIPAVLALMLTLIVGFLPALNIVGEKERGTIEQVNVTPISRIEFIASKLIPYWCVGFVMSVIALLVGRALYGIVPEGSILVMFVFLIVFCVLISSFALLVSNYSSSTQQASLTMFFFLVIFILMSGLLTPIRSMPEWAQWLSLLDPMRHIIEVQRLIFVKGPSFGELLPQFCNLTVFALVCSVWAIASYRKNE